MSYESEHKRTKPVLDLARKLDIATNPDPAAIFEAGSGGFQVWCTPQDHPLGWNAIAMIAGAFSKPCEYIGSVHWKWEEETIVGLQIETAAYAFAEQKPDEYCNLQDIPEGLNRQTIFNRAADLKWLKEKVTWLYETARVPLPPFEEEKSPAPEPEYYLLAHYTAAHDEYVVIVSPAADPRKFCRAGYRLNCTLEIGNAIPFPTDVILRPDREFLESMIVPKRTPLVGRSHKVEVPREDEWLESAYEERTDIEVDV